MSQHINGYSQIQITLGVIMNETLQWDKRGTQSMSIICAWNRKQIFNNWFDTWLQSNDHASSLLDVSTNIYHVIIIIMGWKQWSYWIHFLQIMTWWSLQINKTQENNNRSMKGERICRERPSNSGLINLQITVKKCNCYVNDSLWFSVYNYKY